MKEWYIYEDDEVVGPFTGPELADKIEPDTLVCPAGSEEWKQASERPEVQPYLGQDEEEETDESPAEPSEPTDQQQDTSDSEESFEVPVGDLEPTLDNLKRIAREANAEDLRREFQEFWDEYDRKEQQIIYQEMEHLGILPDD